MESKQNLVETDADVVLIGAGIMSATLGMLLKQLDPEIKIQIFEKLDVPGAESSDAWNNAGTGHSAFCELNYTPEKEDGSIDISKAIKIAESFEVSKQFWAFLVENNIIPGPEKFINAVPHMSFVRGEKDIQYLRKRFEALKSHALFQSMEYIDDESKLNALLPLMMEGRDPGEKVAATYVELGTDVNFGSLTKYMIEALKKDSNVAVHYNHDVKNLKRDRNGKWKLRVKDRLTGEKRELRASFVFIGAGGKSITLLEKSNIPEGRGYGGFPVSGQWLVCRNDEVIQKHHTKVYGKAEVGSPPMSVPHLDTRIIKGKRALLFGPYAGFSTKFLKNGSYLDLLSSIKTDNILPMVSAGWNNIPLTKYLISQVTQSMEERINSLKAFYPEAKAEDWTLENAGMRVQVIKRGKEEFGVLEFGTEVISASDGSLAALLGASPGASTAVSIMLDLLDKCFKGKINTTEWQNKLKSMIPSYGLSLNKDPQLCDQIRSKTQNVLQLKVEEIVH